MNIKKIAIYGKGGIGKSTTTANLSIALSERGLKVMQIGCDPKSDSTRLLTHGAAIPTVLDQLRKPDNTLTLKDIVFRGYKGVYCVEAGGPTPGIGCAGRGIITAFEKLEELGAYETIRPDVVLYDVLGDVVCGGFAMPLRDGYADTVYIVTSGEKMSLYAAANIVSAIGNFKKRNYARYGGLILNCRGIKREQELVEELAVESDGRIISIIPRDSLIQKGEEQNCTIMEAFPDSYLASCYRALADKIWEVS